MEIELMCDHKRTFLIYSTQNIEMKRRHTHFSDEQTTKTKKNHRYLCNWQHHPKIDKELHISIVLFIYFLSFFPCQLKFILKYT